jgi:hypothetical protein
MMQGASEAWSRVVRFVRQANTGAGNNAACIETRVKASAFGAGQTLVVWILGGIAVVDGDQSPMKILSIQTHPKPHGFFVVD